LLPTAANVTTAVWAFDLATAGANTAGAALAAVATSFAKLFRWIGVLAGQGSDPATLAEINATDGGATYNNVTQSQESQAITIGTVGSNVVSILNKFTGITALRNWLGLLAGKGVDATALAEVQATPAGATFSNLTRSLEALGDAVDAAHIGDWAITRTFQVSGGAKVSGVRMSLVNVAGKTDATGSSGVATVKTDDGTFTLRVVVPAGYEDVADTTVVINGADSVATVTLVATTVTPPTNPAKSALEILCLDETGEPEADVAVDIRIAVVPSGDQNIAYKGTKQTATSDANGVARLEAIKGAEYEYKRGKAEVWNRVTIGSGDTTSVSSFIGSP
jgi:hypothetical protein